MKQKLLLKTLLMAVMLLGGANFAWGVDYWSTYKSWDFTTLSSSDLSGFTELTQDGNTYYLNTSPFTVSDQSSKLYGLTYEGAYSNGVKGAFDSNGASDANRGFRLGGAAAKITIPNLKSGQKVTFKLSNNIVIASSQLSDISVTGSSMPYTCTGIVKEDGDVVVARSNTTTIRIRSILVEDPHTYTNALTLDFENAETYLNGWSQSANYNVSLSQIAHGTGKALYLNKTDLASRASTLTYSFSNNSSFVNATDYRLEFDWATCGIGSSNSGEGGIKIYSGSNVIFSVINSNSYSQVFTFINGTTFTCTNQRAETPDPWLHIVLHGTSDGVYATVTNITASPNTTLLDNVKVYSSAANITSFVALSAKSYQNMYLDDIICSIDLTEYKSRASDAISTYSSISSSVMNSTVYSTLNNAYNTLTTDYDTEEKIVADVEGYYDAILALEEAIPAAQTSINDFIILNDLITRANTFAETVTSYEAPEGVSTVYTSNADVDPVALAAAVRAEVIEEGVKNDDTDITAIIINSEFELNSTLGWTIAGDAATATTDLDKYGATESNGSGGYQYYTGWNGRNISQIIPSLPAGKYRLTARVKSWSGGAPVRLFGNGTLSAAENGDDHTPTLEFTTTGNESNVKIGIGGTGNNNDTDNTWGTWGYKIDYFTLTYVGQDELALAKASLAEEIETATALYESWTPKVGTTPFKYDATYYNALNTAIDAAQDVIDADGDVVSAYTSAEDALETAESNMASSTQNAPDPDKYYQIFVANNDGTASDFNLYMLYEKTKTQVKVSATPYPIKIVVDKDNSSYYNIQTPYGNDLCTDKDAKTTAYVENAVGVITRCNQIKFTLNDDGTIKIGGNAGSGNFNNYQAGASEGSLVTAPQGGSGKWVISDVVEITDVNLAVNATTGWGTFIAPYDNLIPSTVKAYTVSHKGSGYIYLEENETGVLNANTPYILSTEEASNVSVALKGIANNNKNTYEVNGLVGLLAAETVPADSYILQYQAGKVGTAFYKLENNLTGTKYRCYLDLDNVPTSSSSRASVRMSIFDDETTGIENLNPALSEGEGVVYNLRGQRVAQPTKGLYIVNGKKVVIK